MKERELISKLNSFRTVLFYEKVLNLKIFQKRFVFLSGSSERERRKAFRVGKTHAALMTIGKKENECKFI